jgi:hypothetical protein
MKKNFNVEKAILQPTIEDICRIRFILIFQSYFSNGIDNGKLGNNSFLMVHNSLEKFQKNKHSELRCFGNSTMCIVFFKIKLLWNYCIN